MMNPDLYAALPRDKKEEYRNTFPVTAYIKRHRVDTSGWYWVWMEPVYIPEEWLSVSKKLGELNAIQMLKTKGENDESEKMSILL